MNVVKQEPVEQHTHETEIIDNIDTIMRNESEVQRQNFYEETPFIDENIEVYNIDCIHYV